MNVEIKAACGDCGRIRGILKSLGADFKGTDHQIDTYFKVNSGRLKLREGNIENHLIFYERADAIGPKRSDVTLFPSDPESSLKPMLLRSLGILAVVDKEREIYFIRNVKFHLDTVSELGTFVEIEAIDADGSIGQEKLREQCEYYLNRFGIQEKDLLSESYSDILVRKSLKSFARA